MLKHYDYENVDTAPIDAKTIETGTDRYDYQRMNKAEGYVMINYLQRLFPVPENVEVEFHLGANPHDAGTYYDIQIRYEDGNEAGQEYAVKVSNEFPAEWDEQALTELKQITGYEEHVLDYESGHEFDEIQIESEYERDNVDAFGEEHYDRESSLGEDTFLDDDPFEDWNPDLTDEDVY